MRPVRVKCYSGRTYADRPSSFMLEGVTHCVEGVDMEWYEPGAKHFRVCTKDDERVELCYDEQNREWSITDLGGKELG